MGQYYKPYLKDAEGNEKTFCSQNAVFMTVHGIESADELDKVPKNWDYNCPTSYGYLFSGLKLMEHSWLGNDFVNGVLETIWGNPCNVAWIGDYANEAEDFDGRIDGYTEDVYKKVWGDGGLPEGPFYFIPEAHLDGYIVNHTMRKYLDLAEYKMIATASDGWCVHPLPLLTAIGNGRGGGDYHECYPNAEYVGCWAMDVIEYTEENPEQDGYREADYGKIAFKEER